MDTELHEEISDFINELVAFGFIPTAEEIRDAVEDTFYGEELDRNLIENDIDKAIRAQQEKEENWEAFTDFNRLDEAFSGMNQKGIVAVHHAGFTQSDGYEDSTDVYEELKGKKIIADGYCFYTSQDTERAMKDNELYLAFGAFVDHDKNGLEIGTTVAKILKDAGFHVIWNGKLNERILIKPFVWQKRFGPQFEVEPPLDAFLKNRERK